MLEKMTESLFAETLKRIAEDVWKKKFTDVCNNLPRWSEAEPLMRAAMVECVKGSPEIQALLKERFAEALTAYLKNMKVAP